MNSLRWWLATGCLSVLAGIVAVGAFAESEFWYVAVPTYLTGAGTLAAAGAAVYIAIRGTRIEERRRAQDQRAYEFGEARKIITLCAWDASPPYGVEVRNLSQEPITTVKIEQVRQVRDHEGTPDPPWYWEFGNGHGVSYAAVLVPTGTFRASGRWREEGDTGEVERDEDGNDAMKMPPTYATGYLLPTVRWRDVRGQHWRRVGSDEPMRLSPDAAL